MKIERSEWIVLAFLAIQALIYGVCCSALYSHNLHVGFPSWLAIAVTSCTDIGGMDWTVLFYMFFVLGKEKRCPSWLAWLFSIVSPPCVLYILFINVSVWIAR